MTLSIVSAKYVAPLKVELHFSDSTVKTVDVGAFIKKHPHPQYNSYLNENKFKKFKIEFGNFIKKHPHPQYNSYLNENKFKKFKIEFGNIVWGKNRDLIFPVDCLYAGTCE